MIENPFNPSIERQRSPSTEVPTVDARSIVVFLDQFFRGLAKEIGISLSRGDERSERVSFASLPAGRFPRKRAT
jgi:hypothetical protein